jgi:hypothetical protein
MSIVRLMPGETFHFRSLADGGYGHAVRSPLTAPCCIALLSHAQDDVDVDGRLLKNLAPGAAALSG